MKYTVKNYFNYHSEIFKKIDVSAIDKISEIIEKKFLSEKKYLHVEMEEVRIMLHTISQIGINL